jgi:hypothetical protein
MSDRRKETRAQCAKCGKWMIPSVIYRRPFAGLEPTATASNCPFCLTTAWDGAKYEAVHLHTKAFRLPQRLAFSFKAFPIYWVYVCGLFGLFFFLYFKAVIFR